MKKKLIPAIAAILAVGIVGLTACSANEKAQFGNYWEKNYTGVNFEASFNETLTYDVSYTKIKSITDLKNPTIAVEEEATSSLAPYTMKYTGGKFTTYFKATSSQTYVYRSDLTISVTYTNNGETSETFTDKVSSYVEFKNASDGLVPTYSEKIIFSHSPQKPTLVSSSSNVNDCYELHHYQIKTTYQNGNGECEVTQYPGVEGKEKKLEAYSRSFNATSDKYDVLDNEQLLIAMRALPLSASTVKIQTYTPFNLGFLRVKLTPSSEIKSANFKVNGLEKAYDFRKIEMVRDGQNPGETQTALFAATNNPESNEARNVLLLLLTPISYNFGSLAYTLKTTSYGTITTIEKPSATQSN